MIYKFKFFRNSGGRVRPLAIAVILLAAIFIVAALALDMRVTRVDEVGVSEDWPQYRHDPAHTGYTDVKGPDDNHVLWEFEVEIYEVWESPAVVDGRVFIPEGGTTEGNYLYSLDARDGKLIWKKEIGSNASSPAVVGGMVYIGGGYDNQIHAFSAENGDEIWSYPLPNPALRSPTVADNRVYYPDYEELYSLDAEDGGLIWKTWRGRGFSPVAVAENRIYGGIPFYSLNAENGEPIWTLPYMWYVGHSVPAIAYGRVYIATYIRENKFSDPNYPLGWGAPIAPKFSAFSTENGELIWSYDALVEKAPAVGKNRVLVLTENGVHSLNATTGELVWKFNFKGPAFSSPIIAGDRVYVGAGSRLYALSLDSGEVLWSYQGYTVGGLAVADGKLFIGSHSGHVVSFGAPLNG